MTPDTWNKDDLASVPVRGTALDRRSPGYEAYRADVVLAGDPDLVVRPENAGEVRDILAHAHAHRIPVTFAGGQTSLTGSSVAEEGILLATERLDRVLDLQPRPDGGGAVAVVEPGIFLGDFQRAMLAEGWSYPPDPTSWNEARLGATVATNATGEDTLLYGPTRRWIRELEVVTPAGEIRTLRRSGADRPLEEKATAGYYLGGEEIDLLIGSEGTLGAITRVTVDLIPRPLLVFGGMAFFPDLYAALRFVVSARRDPRLRPRALELVDRDALDLVGDNPENITWPDGTGAAIYFKQDSRDEAERDKAMEAWLDLLEEHLREAGTPDLLDAVVVMEDPAGRARLREFRHRVPATLHEVVAGYREQGGGKLGTDWWVPFPELPDFLTGWRRRIDETGLRTVIFGHVGNGHPHVNFMPRNASENSLAHGLVLEMCREAVGLGGGVAGEHGLGKVKRDLLGIQLPPTATERMRNIKRRWDPHWILGRGNLFTPEDS